MSGVTSLTTAHKPLHGLEVSSDGSVKALRPGTTGDALLPPPLDVTIGDDLMTSLAMMTIEQKHEERARNDALSRSAMKTQEEAHARKIAKMHDLADDTFATGVIEGITQGVGAAFSGASAIAQYKNAKDYVLKSIDAASGAFKSGVKFVEAAYEKEQELDRADIAVADRDVDRAKGASDSASSESRRAQEDIRDTLNAIRSYTNAKSQLAQAAIIRG